MKLLSVTSFFLFIVILISVCSCESGAKKKKTTSEKIIKNENIAKKLRNNKEYDSAIYHQKIALEEAIKLKDSASIKEGYIQQCYNYKRKEDYDSALIFTDKLYDLSVLLKDTSWMGKARQKKGHAYKKKNSLELAYSNFLEAKEISLKINDSVQVASVLLSIAELEKASGAYGASQSTCIEALGYIENKDAFNLRCKLFYTIAVAAKEQEDLIIADQRINQALALTKDSLTRKKIKNDVIVKVHITHANIFKEKEAYAKAIDIYEGLLNDDIYKLSKKTKTLINANLAYALYLEQGYNKHSDSLLNNSLKFYNDKGNYTREMISVNMKLAELYSIRQPKKAFFYIKEVEKYADTLNNNKSFYEAQQLNVKLFPTKKNVERYLSLEKLVQQEEDSIQTKLVNAKYDIKAEENNTIKAVNKTIKAENQANRFYKFLLGLSLILVIMIVLVFIIYYKIKREHKIEKVKTVHVTEARISSKVHDELANDLYKLISQLETTDPEKETILDKLDLIYNQARDISKQIQRIDTGKGFASELNNLFRSYQSEEVNVLLKRYDIDIWDGISSHVKATIYRVLQELLTNMKKHSNATLVVVSIEKYDKQLFIQYIDNGKGFSEEVSKNGLQNAENRIRAIKGKLTFDTELHKGCKFSINVPV